MAFGVPRVEVKPFVSVSLPKDFDHGVMFPRYDRQIRLELYDAPPPLLWHIAEHD